MSPSKRAIRPDRISWRMGRRGNLLPTHAYILPPIESIARKIDRSSWNPGASTIPVTAQIISLPRISILSSSTQYLDDALRARLF